jgi:hypothetical protein
MGGDMREKKFYIETLYIGHEKFCFYLGNRTLGTYVMMVKSFWGDNDVVL